MTNEELEQDIQDKGLTAPRVMLADVEENISSEHYFTAAQGALQCALEEDRDDEQEQPVPLALLTFCVLVLRNGFTVTGESACVSPENFDTEIGRKSARQNAIAKVWPLMGYALRNRLSGV